MEIQRALESEISAIYAIECEEFSLPWSEKSFREELGNENAVFLSAADGGETVGFAILHHFLNEGEVFNIAVRRTHRRRGIGALLMEGMLKAAAENGVDTIFLDVRKSNIPAQELYKKYGFYELSVRKGYYDEPKEDAVIMIRMKAE